VSTAGHHLGGKNQHPTVLCQATRIRDQPRHPADSSAGYPGSGHLPGLVFRTTARSGWAPHCGRQVRDNRTVGRRHRGRAAELSRRAPCPPPALDRTRLSGNPHGGIGKVTQTPTEIRVPARQPRRHAASWRGKQNPGFNGIVIDQRLAEEHISVLDHYGRCHHRSTAKTRSPPQYPPTPTFGRHPQQVPPCRLTCTDDIFGKRNAKIDQEEDVPSAAGISTSAISYWSHCRPASPVGDTEWLTVLLVSVWLLTDCVCSCRSPRRVVAVFLLSASVGYAGSSSGVEVCGVRRGRSQ
jgi:hypothetical protein